MTKLLAFFEMVKKDKGLLEKRKKLVEEQKAYGKVEGRPEVPTLADDPEFQQSLSLALSSGVKRISRLSNQMMFLARGKTNLREARRSELQAGYASTAMAAACQ